MAEDLAAELMTAEKELLHRPELYSVLGLPKQLRSAFEDSRTWIDTLLSTNVAV